MLDYFTRHYPVEGQQGFNTDENVAHAFVTELKEYCQAFMYVAELTLRRPYIVHENCVRVLHT